MTTDAEIIAGLDAAAAGMPAPRSDAELARDLNGIAESAGIKLRQGRQPTERDKFAALRVRAVEQARRELRAEREAMLSGIDERVWEAKRVEARVERSRQDLRAERRAVEQLRKDAEADRQFARKEKEAAEAALKEAKQVAGEAGSAEGMRRQVAEGAKAMEAEKARLEEWRSTVEELRHGLAEEAKRIDGVLGAGVGFALRQDPARLRKMVEGKLDEEKQAVGEILVRLHRLWMGETLTEDQALAIRRTVGGGIWSL
jgi:hypothetical protein